MPGEQKKRPLLVPVDFSAHSEAALREACELSEALGAPLVVLHVVHDPGDAPGYYTKVSKKKHLMRIEDAAAKMFESFLKSTAKNNPDCKKLKKLETILVTGLPVTRILEIVKKIDARMVVMGSQGRTGFQHMMLGSKAERVAQLCPVPVTIVKAKVKGRQKA
jgi:nucleotide-binding universal stress UspA family protein